MSLNPRLKRPIFLQVLAVLFILAPIGNVILSFIGTGRGDWAEPAVFLSWLSTIKFLDWFWLGLTFSTGILLLIQHKTAWLIAIINLVLILTVNIYRWVMTGELIDVDYSYFQTQILVSVLATASALAIVFYSRYPYLERRSGWWRSLFQRTPLHAPVTLVAQDVFNGQTVDLSLSGTMVELNRSFNSTKAMKFVDVIFPGIRNLKVKCRVVQIKDNRVRLRFKDLSPDDRRFLQAWIDEQT